MYISVEILNFFETTIFAKESLFNSYLNKLVHHTWQHQERLTEAKIQIKPKQFSRNDCPKVEIIPNDIQTISN